MSYATKTSDVNSKLEILIGLGSSYEDALKAIRKHYPKEDKDISDEYIKNEYESLLSNENK